jgi:hypothetical protein
MRCRTLPSAGVEVGRKLLASMKLLGVEEGEALVEKE